jgi:steroid delta-isomerase-like uncharacterized protein
MSTRFDFRTLLAAAAFAAISLVAYVAPAAAQSGESGKGRHQVTVRLIESEFAAWSNQVDKLVTLFTNDLTYEDVTMGVVNRDKQQLASFAKGFISAFPDIKFTVGAMHVDGDDATVEWTFSGTQTGDLPGIPASGRKVSVRGVSIIKLQGLKIKRQTDYWDFATLQRQLTAAPAAPK